MSEHEILLYFSPILDKKDPPEEKELPDPLSKVTTSPSIASCSHRYIASVTGLETSVINVLSVLRYE